MVLVQKVAARSYGRGATTIVEGVGVTSISPDDGSEDGGTDVTITGTNFTGTPTVTIGGNSATNIVVVNSTTITCTTSAHAPGVVDVIVAGSGTGNQLFTFLGPLPALIWASDFGTGTGTSAGNPSAVNDGGRWNHALGIIDDDGSGLEVVSSSGLDFPSTNVLKVTAKAVIEPPEDQSFLRIFKGDLTIPDENESIWYRIYIRHMQPLSQSHFPQSGDYDEANHPIELGFTAGEEISVHCETFTDTQWRIGAGVTAAGNSFANSRWYSPLLDKATTYRYEWQIARLTGLEFNLHLRVYNTSGTLLADDSTFVDRNLGSRFLSVQPVLLLEDVDNLGELCAGLNGLGPVVGPGYWWPSELYQYQGCFAVSLTDWCGAYVPGEADPF